MGLFKPNREKVIREIEDYGYKFELNVNKDGGLIHVFSRPTKGVKSGTASVIFLQDPFRDLRMFAAIFPDNDEITQIPLELYPRELQLFAKYMRAIR